MTQTPEEALAKYWGFNKFRPKQKEIITDVLENKEVLALLPTGGGKSLCYQLPAILKPGIVVVISPLISLMKDQVMQLNEKGIKALHIPGGLPYHELDTLLDNCIYGNYKMLYLSPERLQQELVIERIKQMPISLLAIDEAHCISQWGHDFRPAYRNIATFRQSIPEVSCIALTATATKKVALDIIDQLQLADVQVHQTSFLRENLGYFILPEEDKFYKLERILKKNKGSAIVYVRSRKTAQKFSEFLNQKQISSHHYHGGLGQGERNERFLDWMQGKTQVIVATSAFGMGIDKPDVQSVIHVELPESLESYFQEAGRAGRDGNPANSIILYNPADKDRLQNQFIRVLPSVDYVRTVYKKLNSYFQISYGEGELEVFRFNFMEFCKTYGFNTMITYNALQILDRNSVITLTQEFYRKATLQFKVSAINLTYHLIKNPGIDTIVKSILRTYGGIFDQEMTIDHAAIAQKSKTKVNEVHEALLLLEKDDLAIYKHKNYDTALTFLVPREDDHVINRIARDIKAQNKRKVEQVDALLNFIKNDSVCRSIQLLAYFDEKESTPCGICDVCLKKKRTLKKPKNQKAIEAHILTLLKEKPLSSRDLISAFSNLSDQHLLLILKTMLERRLIQLTATNKYKISE